MEQKEFEISLGAFDSELGGWEYTIPEGFKATIENGKIIVKKSESEDEKIKKAIIDVLKAVYKCTDIPFISQKQTLDSYVAYLEKYGESTEKEKSLIKCLKISNARISELIEENYYLKEKQGEQKSVDKVEPKFKVGDWIINTITKEVEQVIELTDCEYICSEHLIVSFNNQHLLKKWTIQDAKAGDVILDGSEPFIFKKTKYDSKHCYAFCGIGQDGNFMVNPYNWYGKEDPSEVWTWGSYLNPATKEQRNLLFQKMHEAGYEWDAEKKELKKIEKKQEQSEEDEKMFEYALDMIEWYNGKNEDKSRLVSSWLKSLKERYCPQKHWKPSREQINALSVAVKHGQTDDLDALKKLLEQLKTL